MVVGRIVVAWSVPAFAFFTVALLAIAVERTTTEAALEALRLRYLRRVTYLVGVAVLGVNATVAGVLVPTSTNAVAGLAVLVALPTLWTLLAVRYATFSNRRRVRGLGVRFREVAARLTAEFGAFLGVATILVGVFHVAPEGVVRVGALAGSAVLVAVSLPWWLSATLKTRAPTAAEREPLATLLGDNIELVVVDDATRIGSAFAAGVVPGLRRVYVTRSLFDLLSERELAAVVAHEVGHLRRGHLLARTALVVVGPLALLAAYDFGFAYASPLAVVLIGPYVLGTLAAVRATERDADAFAAERVGGEALASALGTLVRANLLLVQPRGPGRILSAHPPIAGRIRALRRGESPPAD